MKILPKEWLAMEPIERFMEIYHVARNQWLLNTKDKQEKMK